MSSTSTESGSSTQFASGTERQPSIMQTRLVERLYGALYHDGMDGGRIANCIEELERETTGPLYSELLFLLSHLRFEEAEARRHWVQILDHQRLMGEKQDVRVDLRVALLSYFLEVNRQFENPKIIELRLFEETRQHAYRDELTGLHNYRLFREYLGREIERAACDNAPLSLVILDVDHFKFFNDHNGHEAGNDALKMLARLLEQQIRAFDIAARYGGEEFVLVLPRTLKTEAHEIAERVRKTVGEHAFRHAGEQPGGRFTVSVGVATWPADATSTEGLIRAADRALYLAKSEGRDRVRLYGLDRRSHRRIDASIRGTFRSVEGEPRPLTTRNVSEAGMLLETESPAERGALVEVDLELPDGAGRVTACARVVSTAANQGGGWEMAMRVVELPSEDRQRLRDYLRATHGSGWTPRAPAERR